MNNKKILIIHNFRQSTAPSGEDMVVNDHHQLLAKSGYDIVTYYKNSDDCQSLVSKIFAAIGCVFNIFTAFELWSLLAKEKPNHAIIHNYFPLISPSIFLVLKIKKIPFSITLHNYGHFCLNGMFLRKGKLCKDCISGAGIVQGIIHKCYKGSMVLSLMKALMIYVEKILSAYQSSTNLIAITDFQKRQVEKILTKKCQIKTISHFISPVISPMPFNKKEMSIVFVGRLGEEKGIQKIVELWEDDLPNLEIIGDGVDSDQIKLIASTKNAQNIVFHGTKDREWISKKLSSSKLLIFPSIVEETFGLTMIEAMSMATPVIALDIGSNREIISEEAGYICKDEAELMHVIKTIDQNELQEKSILAEERARELYSEKKFLSHFPSVLK